jgi:hypothetical protein
LSRPVNRGTPGGWRRLAVTGKVGSGVSARRRRLSILPRHAQSITCKYSFAPSSACAMLLCTSGLQRPIALKAFRNASSRTIVASRKSFCNAVTAEPSWCFIRHAGPRPSRPSQATRISLQSFSKNSFRSLHSYSRLTNRAFIALGSNMGDRVAMIEQACKEMEASGLVKILQTSSLYETKAMYVLDQDNFVNGACEVSRNPLGP